MNFHKYARIFLFTIIVAVFFGCDIVDNNYLQNPGKIPDDTTNGEVRKVLLEEYTGMRCVNCPDGARKAHYLKERYGNKLILMSVHAGYWSEPKGEFTYDFRTSVGTELNDFFGIIGNPTGLVSRNGYSNNHRLTKDSWEPAIVELFKQEPKVLITLSAEIDTSGVNKEITVDVELEFLEAGTTSDYLAVYILEDKIIQKQQDGSVIIPDYEHNNVFRASINGTWGSQISSKNIPASSIKSKKYSYEIPQGKDWNIQNLRILAYVHDYGNSYEIWQVETAVPAIK